MRALILAVTVASAGNIDAPPYGSFCRDLTGRISPSTMIQLETLARELDDSGNGQLGVLVTRTTEGQVPRAYATEVFNHWGIGHAGRNDGVMLFVALDDRKAEIVIGDGLRGRLPQATTDAVMRDQVVANFKAGRPEQALLDGARRLTQLMASRTTSVAPMPQPVQRVERPMPSAEDLRQTAVLARGDVPDPSPRGWVIDLTGSVSETDVHRLEEIPNELYARGAHELFILVFRAPARTGDVALRAAEQLWKKHPKAAVLGINTFASVGATILPKDLFDDARTMSLCQRSDALAGQAPDWAQVKAAEQVLRPVLLEGWPRRAPDELAGDLAEQHKGALGFAGVALLLGGGFWGRRWNRYRTRHCDDCHRPRQLLGVGREDRHLSEGQKAEQAVGSVDYDVWWCGACRNVLILDNTAWFSGYGRCDSCGHRTSRSTTTTLESATEWSGGTEQIDSTCASCGHTSSYTRTTARLSSSSSSDWSSSSSSDSSFGGGSSSGSGSSGSW